MRGGAFAWSAGKQVSARDEAGSVRTWTAPSTVRGLAFQPKGYRLAVTHYNGASLWFPKVEGPPQTLEWKGAHLDATFSPDGRFRHLDAGERAARLAGRRFAQHAHDRLSRKTGRCRGRTTGSTRWSRTTSRSAGGADRGRRGSTSRWSFPVRQRAMCRLANSAIAWLATAPPADRLEHACCEPADHASAFDRSTFCGGKKAAATGDAEAVGHRAEGVQHAPRKHDGR